MRHLRERSRRGTRAGERGSTSLELAVLAPALLLLLSLIIIAGRIAVARQGVETAADAAARAASIARTPTSAADDAQAAAAATLANSGLNCATVSVEIDTSGFAVAVGLPATVSATVTCTVDTGGLSVPGLSGQTLTRTATSPIDTYRTRTDGGS